MQVQQSVLCDLSAVPHCGQVLQVVAKITQRPVQGRAQREAQGVESSVLGCRPVASTTASIMADPLLGFRSRHDN